MQPDSKVKKLLWDILENSEAVSRYLSELDFEVFREDDKTQAAVERRLEIVGEALRRLRDIDEALLSKRIPDFYKIIGLRNHISHGYDSVDLETLWDASINHLPLLVEVAQKWMKEL